MLKNFLLVGAGNYGAMGLSLIINAVLTRRLGVDQFGHLALLLTASQVLAMGVSNWTHIAMVRFGAQEVAQTGTIARAFWTRVWIVVPWMVAALAIVAAARQYLAAYLMVPPWGLSIIVVHFVTTLLAMTIGTMLQAKNDMRRYGTLLLLDKTLMAVLLIVLLKTPLTTSPLAVLGLYAASSITAGTWGLFALGVRSVLPVTIDRAAFRDMLAFSFPLLLSSWVGLFGTSWIDILIIRRYRPLSEVGLYSLGTVLAGVVQQITIIFSTLLLPQLSVMVSRGQMDRIRRFIDRVLPYWFLATAIVFAVVLLVAAPVVPLIFGRAFARAGEVLAVLMVAACALALFNAFSPLMSALGATWALTGIAVASGIVNLLMDLVLIPSYGIQGAAIATVLAYATSAILVMTYVQRRLEQNVFRLALLTLPVVAACACFLLFRTVAFYVVSIPLGLFSVFWLTIQFRLFRPEDAMFLKDLRWRAL